MKDVGSSNHAQYSYWEPINPTPTANNWISFRTTMIIYLLSYSCCKYVVHLFLAFSRKEMDIRDD